MFRMPLYPAPRGDRGALPLSGSVGMWRPLDTPPLFFFSPEVHPLVGYSCWVSFFRFEPLSLSNICEFFIFSRSIFWGHFCEKFILRLGFNFTPRILRLGWKFTPRTPHPNPFRCEVPKWPDPPLINLKKIIWLEIVTIESMGNASKKLWVGGLVMLSSERYSSWKMNAYCDGILPKGPCPPCLRMADRALLPGYHRI